MTTEQKLKEALRLITESSHDEAAVNTAQMALDEVEDAECEKTPPLASAYGSRSDGMDALTVKERQGVRVINPLTMRRADTAWDELTGDIIDGRISGIRATYIQHLMDGYCELKRSLCANDGTQRRASDARSLK